MINVGPCVHQLRRFLNISSFAFGCAGSSLLSSVFLQLQPAGAALQVRCTASLCGGFCCRPWALGCWGFSSQQFLGSRAQITSLGHGPLVTLWQVGSSQTRDRTHVSSIGRQGLDCHATREAPVCLLNKSKTSIRGSSPCMHVTYGVKPKCTVVLALKLPVSVPFGSLIFITSQSSPPDAVLGSED